MSSWVFLKTFSDLCLYFSVVAVCPSLFPCDFTFLWPVMLCSVAAAMGSVMTRLGKPQLRFLALPVAAACLVLADSVLEVLVLLPGIVYAIALIIRNHMAVEYVDFRAVFKRTVVIWCICFGFLSMYCAFEEALLMEETSFDYQTTFWYGLLYALSAVLLLRLLRMGEEAESAGLRMNNLQTAAVMGGAGAVVIGSALAEKYFRGMDTSLLWELWSGLMTVIVMPVHALVALIQAMLPEENKGQTEATATEATSAGAAVGSGNMGEATVQPEEVAEDAFPWWFVILLLVVLTVLLVVLVRRFTGKGTAAHTQERTDTVRRPEKTDRKSRRSNRNRVRQCYRDFLRVQRRKGVILRTNQTSADILDQAAPGTDLEAAAALRQVYIQARYDPGREVSRQQVEQAREAARKLND